MLIACVDDEVVDDLGLGACTAAVRYTCRLGMTVRDDRQGRGVGTVLMEAALAAEVASEERGRYRRSVGFED